MKETAYLISTSRGSVVDEAALIRALREGWIQGAGVDVFEREPVDPENPILKMDNVVVSPHSLCHTDEFFKGTWDQKLRQASQIISGEIPEALVNREVLEAGDIEVAEELLVNLDARDPTAGEEVWENHGTMDDFQMLGAPVVEQRDFGVGVSFNENGRSGDTYESIEDAPPGILGPDPSRSIEIWVWNETIATEETLVAWGKRGGPDGSNMSFNYGNHGAYGAVGHWGSPDLGWNNGGGAPAPEEWHHLVYTFDGDDTGTTRVYADGCLVAFDCEFTNEEVLGPGALNAHPGKIRIAQQTEGDGVNLTLGLQGKILVSKVRVHDGVLTADQIANNYEVELPEFQPGPDEICDDGIDNDRDGDADCDDDGVPDGLEVLACILLADCDGDGAEDKYEANKECVQNPECVPAGMSTEEHEAGLMTDFGEFDFGELLR